MPIGLSPRSRPSFCWASQFFVHIVDVDEKPPEGHRIRSTCELWPRGNVAQLYDAADNDRIDHMFASMYAVISARRQADGWLDVEAKLIAYADANNPPGGGCRI